MPLSKSSGIFGIRDAKITELSADVEGSAVTYAGTSVDIPGIKSLGMEKQVKELESRGDEKVLDTESMLEYINVSWENMELPLEACAIIENTTITTSGTGATEQHIMAETGGSSGKYFKLEAWAKRGTNDIKDVKVVLYKVRGTLTYSFKGEDYAICSFKGKAIPTRGTVSSVAYKVRDVIFGAGTIS